MIRGQNSAPRSAVTLALTAGVLLVLGGGCAVSPTQSATAIISTSGASTGTPTISDHLVLLPEALTIRHGESWSFTAALAEVGYPVITHQPEAVTWNVLEGGAGGFITSDGVYTAPAVAGTYHVVGASTANPASTATTVVTVGAGLALSGDTEAARIGQTATLLPNGEVLVAGGASDSALDLQATLFVYRADLYDPATGIFQFAAPVTRGGGTATLLPNGDVLFLGGDTTIVPSGPNDHPVTPIPTATAEVFNAATGTVKPAGTMSIARAGHTATLLPNGRILITGGETPLPSSPPYSAPTNTAELYDPASGTSSPAGNMSVALSGQQAVLLSNGKVLILGAGSAQIYDPTANTFTPVSSLALLSDSGFTVTLLSDGRVLVAGGVVPDPPYYGGVSVAAVQLYNPTSGEFTSAGKMTIPRSSHTATLMPDGTVLFAGGSTAAPDPGDDEPVSATTEIFNPFSKSFTAGHTMKTPREGHTATLLPDGTILFLGGAWDNPSIADEIFP